MNTERHRQLAEALDHILQTLITQYRPEKVILFGSMASGHVGEWSDLDLVILKDTRRPFVERSVEVGLLCRARVGVDYLVYTPTEFEQMLSHKNLFILEEVIGKGKVLYERKPVTALA